MVEAQFQLEAPDPYPPNKWRTDLGTIVVLYGSSSVTYILTIAKIILDPLKLDCMGPL